MVRQVERFYCYKVDRAQAFADAYAARLKNLVFATATSDNHGRGLAWAAQALGACCPICVPRECPISEIVRWSATIAGSGAYKPVMERCRADCARKGWTFFSDTSWPNYTEIPTDIMLVSAHIMREVGRQFADWDKIPYVAIQGGVGAAGIIAGLPVCDPAASIKVMVVSRESTSDPEIYQPEFSGRRRISNAELRADEPRAERCCRLDEGEQNVELGKSSTRPCQNGKRNRIDAIPGARGGPDHRPRRGQVRTRTDRRKISCARG
jgi:hypothetical protein